MVRQGFSTCGLLFCEAREPHTEVGYLCIILKLTCGSEECGLLGSFLAVEVTGQAGFQTFPPPVSDPDSWKFGILQHAIALGKVTEDPPGNTTHFVNEPKQKFKFQMNYGQSG